MPGARSTVLVMVLLCGMLAACGNPASSDTTICPTTTAAATTSVPSTTEPGLATTTTAGSTTTTTAASTPTSTTLPPWEDPSFPEALPPKAIPWEEVGTGWLLIRYQPAHPADGEVGEALFLIGPDDTMYAVAPRLAGERMLDWSPEGRRVLSVREGRLRVTDLSDGTAMVVPNDLYGSPPNEVVGFLGSWARFTQPTGRDIVVRLLDWNNNQVRLETLRTDGARFAQLADLDSLCLDGWDPDHVFEGITWLYAASGTEVAVATTDGIQLLTNLGAVIRPLDTPGLGCTLSRWWDEGSVLAACHDRDWAASSCWTRGAVGPGGGRSLWSVPLDGSAASRLTTVPVCDPESQSPEFWPESRDALAVGGVLAVESETCCECGLLLDFINEDTVIRWTGCDGSPACAPDLIGRRGDGLVVLETFYGEGHFGTLFRTAADGTILYPITPFSPGDYGGVVQVLTTEETALIPW